MSIHTLILIGIAVIAITSLIALVHAITHAEEGFENDAGYHRKTPDNAAANTATTTVDTGNPWDQLEGSSCPWSFKPTLGHNDLSAHQS